MNCLNWHAKAAVLVAVALGWGGAQAGVLTFDDPDLANLYPGYVKIPTGDYTVSFQSDGGLIGTVDDLEPGSEPTGNRSQFLLALNSGFVTLQRADRQAFDLLSFDMAYVPHPDGPPAPSMAFIARGGNATAAWNVDNSIASHPFLTFNDPIELAGLSNVTQVAFSFCSFVPATREVCGLAIGGAGQFALDNIVVRRPGEVIATVPEPSSLLLVAAALAGVAARRRKKAQA